MILIKSYFPELTTRQVEQLEMLMPLYAEWNSKINLISRKDFENFYPHHVLHSLAIAKFIQFNNNATVIDIGTGGGFPGIPLAILFPEVNFILVDSITKKIKVVKAVISQLGLSNAKALNQRAEQVKDQVDYIISRATAPLPELVKWTNHLLIKGESGSQFNGWIVLKGGELEAEVAPFSESVKIKSIADYFKEPYFETKKLVYLAK